MGGEVSCFIVSGECGVRPIADSFFTVNEGMWCGIRHFVSSFLDC